MRNFTTYLKDFLAISSIILYALAVFMWGFFKNEYVINTLAAATISCLLYFLAAILFKDKKVCTHKNLKETFRSYQDKYIEYTCQDCGKEIIEDLS